MNSINRKTHKILFPFKGLLSCTNMHKLCRKGPANIKVICKKIGKCKRIISQRPNHLYLCVIYNCLYYYVTKNIKADQCLSDVTVFIKNVTWLKQFLDSDEDHNTIRIYDVLFYFFMTHL